MVIEIFETITEGTASRVSYLVNNAQDNITVRLNSPGGSVFSALTIHNLLKARQVEVEILGLAASSASLIACAGSKVSMAANALMMIHAPSCLLVDYYNKQSLDKLTTTLAKTEESIVMAYRNKVANFEMPSEELWLSATEAKSLGFVDEIIGEVPITMTAAQVVMNGLAFDKDKLKGAMNRMTGLDVRQEELKRIRSLEALKADCKFGWVIDMAIEQGKTVDETKAFLDKLKTQFDNQLAQEVNALRVQDNFDSGAQEVPGQQNLNQEQVKAMQVKKIIAYANGGKL